MSDCYVIKPTAITEAMLTSTTVSENDYSEWSDSTTYSADDYVIVTAEASGETCTEYYLHKIYKCVSGNTDKWPPDYLADTKEEGQTTRWELIGPTNAWKMFDNHTLSATTDSDEIEIELTPDTWFNSWALFCDCATIDIVMDDPTDGEVYSETINTADLSVITDYYSWFFTEPPRKQVHVIFDLPMYPDATTTITFTDTGETVTVGEVILGMREHIGQLLYGFGIGLEDYSIKTTDANDNITLSGDTTADNASFKLKLPPNSMYRIKQLLAQYHATWLVWVGATWRPETTIYGKYDSLRMVAQSTNYDYCTLNILEAS